MKSYSQKDLLKEVAVFFDAWDTIVEVFNDPAQVMVSPVFPCSRWLGEEAVVPPRAQDFHPGKS